MAKQKGYDFKESEPRIIQLWEDKKIYKSNRFKNLKRLSTTHQKKSSHSTHHLQQYPEHFIWDTHSEMRNKIS